MTEKERRIVKMLSSIVDEIVNEPKPIVAPVVNFVMPENNRKPEPEPEPERVDEPNPVVKDLSPTDRQKPLMSSEVDIAIWVPGLRICGKTWALLLEAARHVQNKNHRAAIFRRVYASVNCAGGTLPSSQEIYPWLGGKLKNTTWTFPSGAEIVLGHLHSEDDSQSWIGSSLPVICFDGLEEFSESIFLSMLETNHGQDGSKGYIRATASLSTRGDNWLLDFLIWWTMGGNQPIADRIGVVRWMGVVGGKIVWADTQAELLAKYKDVTPRSVTLLV